MRNLFANCNGLGKKDEKAFWQDCVFAFDANMLLNVYRYKDGTQKRFLEILERLREDDRIWLPHQAGLEFHRDREGVINTQTNAFSEIKKFLVNEQQKIEKELLAYDKDHPSIDAQTLLGPIAEAIERAKAVLDEGKPKHPNYHLKDPLKDKLSEVFEGRTGSPYRRQRLLRIYREADLRYQLLIPPGYKDAEDKKGYQKYGDVVLWMQIIDLARNGGKPVAFVTEDSKEDWWVLSSDKKKVLRPRPELVQEVLQEAGVAFTMMQTDGFIERAEKSLGLSKEPAVLEDIREVREQGVQALQAQMSKVAQMWEAASGGSNKTMLGQIEQLGQKLAKDSMFSLCLPDMTAPHLFNVPGHGVDYEKLFRVDYVLPTIYAAPHLIDTPETESEEEIEDSTDEGDES